MAAPATWLMTVTYPLSSNSSISTSIGLVVRHSSAQDHKSSPKSFENNAKCGSAYRTCGSCVYVCQMRVNWHLYLHCTHWLWCRGFYLCLLDANEVACVLCKNSVCPVCINCEWHHHGLCLCLLDASVSPLYALIVTPTRELAMQIRDHIHAVTKYTNVSVRCILLNTSRYDTSCMLCVSSCYLFSYFRCKIWCHSCSAIPISYKCDKILHLSRLVIGILILGYIGVFRVLQVFSYLWCKIWRHVLALRPWFLINVMKFCTYLA